MLLKLIYTEYKQRSLIIISNRKLNVITSPLLHTKKKQSYYNAELKNIDFTDCLNNNFN